MPVYLATGLIIELIASFGLAKEKEVNDGNLGLYFAGCCEGLNSVKTTLF
jgi:hypothetical protein